MNAIEMWDAWCKELELEKEEIKETIIEEIFNPDDWDFVSFETLDQLTMNYKNEPTQFNFNCLWKKYLQKTIYTLTWKHFILKMPEHIRFSYFGTINFHDIKEEFNMFTLEIIDKWKWEQGGKSVKFIKYLDKAFNWKRSNIIRDYNNKKIETTNVDFNNEMEVNKIMSDKNLNINLFYEDTPWVQSIDKEIMDFIKTLEKTEKTIFYCMISRYRGYTITNENIIDICSLGYSERQLQRVKQDLRRRWRIFYNENRK